MITDRASHLILYFLISNLIPDYWYIISIIAFFEIFGHWMQCITNPENHKKSNSWLLKKYYETSYMMDILIILEETFYMGFILYYNYHSVLWLVFTLIGLIGFTCKFIINILQSRQISKPSMRLPKLVR